MTWHTNLRAQLGCAETISANFLKERKNTPHRDCYRKIYWDTARSSISLNEFDMRVDRTSLDNHGSVYSNSAISKLLREAARIFRESKISGEKSNFFLFCQNTPFCELVSKKIF